MADTNLMAIKDADVLVQINRWAADRFLPFYQGTNFEAWKQDVFLAIVESKDLRSCLETEQGKTSLSRALQRSASTGLSLNPQKGESALVVIGGKVNFWPMKNGIVKKALETGALEFIESNTVYEKDTFRPKKTARGDDYEFEFGLGDRGKATGFFAVAVLKSGRSVLEYWTWEQAEAHKTKWGKGLTNADSAWSKNTYAMHEKTVLKALLSGLHLPPAVAALIEQDNTAEAEAMRDVTEPEPKGTGAADLAQALTGSAEERQETPPDNGEGEAGKGELDIF